MLDESSDQDLGLMIFAGGIFCMVVGVAIGLWIDRDPRPAPRARAREPFTDPADWGRH